MLPPKSGMSSRYHIPEARFRSATERFDATTPDRSNGDCARSFNPPSLMTSSWTPPAGPDPSDILDSAALDANAGWHEQALAKFLWFHKSALRYDPHLSAVRLS